MSLEAKQARFVQEYLVDLNATKAAERAGYSAKTARQQGTRLLSKASIQGAIEAGLAKRDKQSGITQERVLRELELITFSDIRHYVFDPETRRIKLRKGAPKGATRAISSVTFESFTGENGTSTKCKLTLWNKTGVIELAGKHVGLFAEDKKQESAPSEIHVHVDIPPRPEPGPAAQDSTLPGAKS